MKNGYKTVDYIIRSYIADLGRNTLHGYLRYLKWALDGLRDWHLDSGQEMITQCIQVNPNHTVDLPDDYIAWTKIGVSSGDRIVCFVRDSTIKMNDTYGVDQKNDSYKPYNGTSATYIYDFVNYTDTSGNTGSLTGYGYGHNGVGYFNIDNGCRQIRLSSDVTAQHIYLEYLSNGFDASTETLVNEHAYMLLLEYIRWREARQKFGDAAAETQLRKQEYLNELDKSMRRLSDLSYEGLMDIIARTTTLAVVG